MDGNNQSLPTSSQPMYDDQMQPQHLYEQQRQTDQLRNMSLDDLVSTIQTLQSNLNEVSNRQENQQIGELQRQLNDIRVLLSTRTEPLSTGPILTPGTTPHVGHRNEAGQRPEKPRLPNVEVFDKGSHEQYLQWKMKVQAKLYGDRMAYPSEDDRVNYVITRTNGQAFNALTPMVAALMNGTAAPSLATLWANLDNFFKDPTARGKALEYLRTTKQGKNDFNPHVQEFNIKLQEAELDNASDAQKIDYLKNSLNSKLLRTQAGFQPPIGESYEQFVQRSRVTWENIKAVDRITTGRRYTSYDTPDAQRPPRRSSNEMDWQPTVGAYQPRTRKREYWGTEEEIQERRTSGACLKCGQQGHRVRECKKKALSSPPRTTKWKPSTNPPKVAAAQSAEEVSSSSDEEGKAEL
jgi:hypothetical protein